MFKLDYAKTIFLSLICLFACQTSQPAAKKRVMHIFVSDKSTFRGCNLGDSLSKVKQQAQISPQHEDWLGLVYSYQLEKNCKMDIEYYADNAQTGRKSNRLSGIIANITLTNEIETADLYEEIQEYLTQKYGAATGNFGNFLWEEPLLNLEILLKLHPNKKEITLNFLAVNSYQ